LAEDKAVSREQVKRITERALVIERYILRRAWGLGYAVVAADIAIVFFLSFALQAAGFTSAFGLAVRVAVNTAVNLAAVAVMTWVLKKAYDAVKVRRVIMDSIWTRLLRPKWVATVWLVYYMPILLAILFLRPEAAVVLYGVLSLTSLSLFFVLKVSFPEQLPKESKAVVAAYAVSTVGSLIFFLLNAKYFAVFLGLWVLAIAVFVWAAVYARRQKPPNPLEDHADW
jgi:hypothetical protein